MILVDPRNGSRELKHLLDGHGVPVEFSAEEMPAGDFAFEGRGPEGVCFIGIERKTLRDMLSSIRTGRFAGHQLPAMLEMYRFQYLIVEGVFRPNSIDGLLEEWRGGWSPVHFSGHNQGFMYQELAGALFTFEQMTSLKVHKTSTPGETASHIISLYRWWNSKDWDRHRAHEACNAGHVEILRPWPLIRRWANDLPGVGQERSREVASHFLTPREMANAEEREWRKVPGIGNVTAHKIFTEINAIRKP